MKSKVLNTKTSHSLIKYYTPQAKPMWSILPTWKIWRFLIRFKYYTKRILLSISGALRHRSVRRWEWKYDNSDSLRYAERSLYLHKKDFTHTNIKLSNVKVYSTDSIVIYKLCDFNSVIYLVSKILRHLRLI